MSANPSIAEQLAAAIVALDAVPAAVRAKCEDLAVDVAGLCITARNEDYVRSALAGCDDDGPCTAIGHARTLSAGGAAFVNGTAAHGEDFDDTFEGGPVHAGAVIVPAVLAACERHQRDGKAALVGIAVGCEVMCRLSTVVPKAVHKAGFHPTAIFGVMGAAAGVAATLGLDAKQIVDALGIAGSMAGGIIEYLTDGAWTKRLHPGWAAQSGYRAALLARAGFFGPRTVFEGTHGLFHGFAHTTQGDYAALLGDFGKRWVIETLAFKPYPCGTMAHPYIDCARRLAARGIKPDEVKETCLRGGGRHRAPAVGAARREAAPAQRLRREILHALHPRFRLRARRRRARCLHRRGRARSRRARACRQGPLRDRSRNPYPKAFTGHIRAVLKDGRVIEERQPHFRGGANEPLTRADVAEKFMLNARHGGWDEARANAALKVLAKLYDGAIDLAPLRG